jgi:uncharacterized protein YijF (DUF1287 family)
MANLSTPIKKTRTTARATEIYISVDSDGEITIEPYYAEFQLGETLVWRADEGIAWTIGFRDSRTPTDKKVIKGNGAGMDGDHVAHKRGHFRYAVAMAGEGEGRLEGMPVIFLDAACPEIIID